MIQDNLIKKTEMGKSRTAREPGRGRHGPAEGATQPQRRLALRIRLQFKVNYFIP